ncbi:MAG: hypothetical protein HY445_03105 [Candidatus Niyogibacteria bacterium]|nr:hypothetical protein [Candidatus Niyogibacteria bacterium]
MRERKKMTASTRGLSSLAAMLNKENSRPHHFQGMKLSLDILNVLPQPRKTFEEIEYLANDIAQKNLYNPLTVACFGRSNCQRYLELINLLWGVNFSIEELISVTEDGVEFFYVLLAGERRYRSCLYIRDVGCERCHEKFGPSGCYERHFSDLKVDVRSCIDISPLEAIFIQASENIHMRVPPHEEAKFYNQLFKLLKEINPEYHLSEFSRQVGRSPETIRQALRFCGLPLKYQEYIEKGKIVWGIGAEIAKLYAQGNLNEKDLEWWIIKVVTGNYKVPEFRKMVSKFLFDQNAGQTSFFDQKQEEQLRRLDFRLVVQRYSIIAIYHSIYYLNRVFDLFVEGKLGKKDSPFSERSPIRIFRKLIELEAKLLPHLRNLLPERENERAQKVIEETKVILSRLEEKLPKTISE